MIALSVGCSSRSPVAAPVPCAPQTIAALDIGSGSTKLQVAEDANCGAKVGRTLLTASAPVGFRDDLEKSPDGSFSPAVIAQGEAAVRELLLKATSFRPVQIRGVATAAFRKAKNGAETIARWRQLFSADLAIIDQNEEAALGFRAAIATTGYDAATTVVWDIGGGSQQISWQAGTDGLRSIQSNLASVTFKNDVLKQVKAAPTAASPNPLSATEVQQAFRLAKSLSRKELSSGVNTAPLRALRALLAKRSTRVVGIGGVFAASLSKQLSLAPGEPVTVQGLITAIARQTGKFDQEIGGKYAETDVTNLILVRALLETLGIQAVEVVPANLTDALVISDREAERAKVR